jgi:hypothetical protein
MSVSAEDSKREKRKISRLEGAQKTGKDNVNKRARASPMMQQQIIATFHECHLTMLQSLDGHGVNSDTWKQAHAFLQQRAFLLKNQRERQKMCHVHQAAVEHVLKQSQGKADHHRNKSKAGLFMSPPPQQHAQSPSMFSPLTTSPASDRPSRHRASLALVARLLGQRVKASDESMQQPFASLLQETHARMQELERSLQSLKHDGLETNRQKMAQLVMHHQNATINLETSADHNKIVEAETKIRLWGMLAHALHQVNC